MQLFFVPYLLYCKTNTSPSRSILRNPTYGELSLIKQTQNLNTKFRSWRSIKFYLTLQKEFWMFVKLHCVHTTLS